MTSTPATEQGPAVALSIGGRAQTLAFQMPVNMLVPPKDSQTCCMSWRRSLGPKTKIFKKMLSTHGRN